MLHIVQLLVNKLY